MKASELMIGNYVIYRGQIIKITSIYDKGGSNEVGWSDKESVWVNADNVKPIPLTPEILEKNGFENTSVIIVGTPKMRWVSEDERTEITIWIDGTTPMEIRKNVYYEDEESYTLPSPVCVHELQNVLRLCGIEKEITI